MSYLVDFDKFADLVKMDNESDTIVETKVVTDEKGHTITTTKTYPRSQELDGPKYELFTKLLELILISPVDNSNSIEDMLDSNTFGYRLAFETLEERGIIKYVEDKI